MLYCRVVNMKTYCCYNYFVAVLLYLCYYMTGSESHAWSDKVCVPIKECTEVVRLLRTKPLTNEIKERIFDLRCAEDSGGVKVWCGNDMNKICVPIKECMEVLDLLKQRPISDRLKQYIKSLQCENDEHSPKVWCEVKSNGNGQNLLPDPDEEECGVQTEGRITHVIAGGHDAKDGEFPWMALLEYRLINLKLVAQCGGTLINNRYVLTAAHCLSISARQGKLESVRLGELYRNGVTGDENRYEVESVTVHPSYEASAKVGLYHNDIGLVRVNEEVIYTDVVIPICLPTPDFNEMMEELEVAGWGETEDGTASAELQKLIVPYYDTMECTKLLMYNVTETQICAGGDPGKDSCKGDSGAPLMYYKNWYTTQVGIVSLSIGKICGAGRPNIYTNVQKFMLWIYGTLRP